MAGTILSVDIGTSSLKAAFIDLDGKLLSFSRETYQQNADGKHSAAAWELAFIRALEKLFFQTPQCGIDGICVSGNGPTLVPVTAGGENLPPLYWHDGRRLLPEAKDPAAQSAGQCGAQAAAKTPRSFFLPHAAWLKENARAEYEKTAVFLSPHEWLSHRLGAETFAVLPSASYEPYFWDDEQCRLFDLDRKKFPPFVKMGSVMGKVSGKAASFLGAAAGNSLKSGTPIIAGGTDFITALIGTGTLHPGEVCNRAGSSEGINVCAAPGSTSSASPPPVEAGGLRVLPHAREGLWNIGKVIPASGRLFEWYRSFTGQEALPYETLLAELIPDPLNPEIFRKLDFSLIPSFPVPRSPFPSPCSPVPSPPLELGRSVLCAIAFAVKDAAETLAGNGFPVNEMKISGGQAKNPRWNQLKADISGITLIAQEIPDGELAGNAVLSATALGTASSIEEAAARMIRVRHVYKPRPEAAAFWEERHSLQRQRAQQRT